MFLLFSAGDDQPIVSNNRFGSVDRRNPRNSEFGMHDSRDRDQFQKNQPHNSQEPTQLLAAIRKFPEEISQYMLFQLNPNRFHYVYNDAVELIQNDAQKLYNLFKVFTQNQIQSLWWDFVNSCEILTYEKGGKKFHRYSILNTIKPNEKYDIESSVFNLDETILLKSLVKFLRENMKLEEKIIKDYLAVCETDVKSLFDNENLTAEESVAIFEEIAKNYQGAKNDLIEEEKASKKMNTFWYTLNSEEQQKIIEKIESSYLQKG